MDSKKSKAFLLFNSCLNQPDDVILDKFVNELFLNENTAKTYLSLCKRRCSNKFNFSYKKRKIDARKTKKGKALELFRSNTNLSRKNIIRLFVKELDMSENSASVHCSMCIKEYSGPKHKAIS